MLYMLYTRNDTSHRVDVSLDVALFYISYNKQMWMIVPIMMAFAMKMQPALIMREDTIVCVMPDSLGMACFVSVRYTSHQMVCRDM